MATGSDVLKMLRPNGGWSIQENNFESIGYDPTVEPISKEEFEAGFDSADDYFAQIEANKIAKREAALAKLAALGLTTDDLKALGL